jgi:hypothetical protein
MRTRWVAMAFHPSVLTGQVADSAIRTITTGTLECLFALVLGSSDYSAEVRLRLDNSPASLGRAARLTILDLGPGTNLSVSESQRTHQGPIRPTPGRGRWPC